MEALCLEILKVETDAQKDILKSPGRHIDGGDPVRAASSGGGISRNQA
jgi:hypothetical protein